MNIDYFNLSRNLVLQRQELALGGIGTLGEKTVHSTLKQYLSQDLANQEIKIGTYYADVCVDGHIFEIQTRQFNKLRSKLDFFLTDHLVTVVYPVTNYNYLRWVTPDTGEITPPKKSSRKGNPLQVFAELYRIRPFLSHPNFSLKIILMDMEEYRLLDGYGKDKKKRATKCDKFPLSLVAEYDIETPQDYMMLLPPELPEAFTTKEFAKLAKIPLGLSQTTLLLLTELGLTLRTGKQGNAYIYELNE
ncbi:MAG: hypothetical protein IJ274_00015 [Lachnospiraceae bacterium]|nr:hypothetical protein [Lachnospiraceae bacterium]